MYPLFLCDLEGGIYDAKHTYILILKPSFNLLLLRSYLLHIKRKYGYQEPFHVQIKAIKISGLLSIILPNPRY
jgi:hypothetical protein